mgnify:FL=1
MSKLVPFDTDDHLTVKDSDMDLLELEHSRRLRREEAAAWLHQLADSLERHNDVEFVRDGLRYRVIVADEIQLDVELEVENDGAKLEIELRW